MSKTKKDWREEVREEIKSVRNKYRKLKKIFEKADKEYFEGLELRSKANSELLKSMEREGLLSEMRMTAQYPGQPYIHTVKRMMELAKAEISNLETELLSEGEKYINEYLHSDITPYVVVREFTRNKYGAVRCECKLTEDSRQKINESFVPGGFCGTYDNSLQKWEITVPEYKEEDIKIFRRKKNGLWSDGRRGIRLVLSQEPVKRFDFNF